MSSEFKKEGPKYAFFFFLSNVPLKESPPGSPIGLLWREQLVYGSFFKYISNSS
jgi:hypothetical protein